MIRVTLIAGTYEPNRCGVAHYTDRLRTSLQKIGVQTVVLTTHAAAHAAQRSDVIGAVHHWGLPELWSLVRSLHATPTDILHIQHAAGTYSFERAIFLLPLLLKATGWHQPIVTTVHEYGWWEWQPSWIPSSLMEWLKQWGQHRGWWDREDGFLLTHSNAIITTNRNAEATIRERLPAFNDASNLPPHQQRLYAIGIGPNIEVAPIDPIVARQTLRQHCHWADNTDVIAFFGFLHPVKGLETLLAAFKHVVAKHPHARLLMIGGVESLALVGEQAAQYWQQLHTLVTTLELDQTVHFTGYLSAEAASHYLSGADIGVLPFNHGVTLKSGSLLALLMHRLPVIATRADPPDCALNDNLLRLIAPRNVDQLAIALNQLLSDPIMRDHLGQAGHEFAQTLEWNAISTAHLQVYQSVLECSPITNQTHAKQSMETKHFVQ